MNSVRKTNFQVLIIGGGLAGLTSALHLAKKGVKVLLIEKNSYPKHKVCGEYISNEVLPYLNSLGLDPLAMGAPKINKFELSTIKSRFLQTELPLGGFGMSRYALDHKLVKEAIKNGVQVLEDTVLDVKFTDNNFTVVTKNNGGYGAKLVLGAYGKRSSLDVKLNRSFIKNKSPYLAVKGHYTGDFPADVVAIHNFKGGYCGVSKVENNRINICYITNYAAFGKFKNIADFEKNVVFKNTYLKALFENCTLEFEKPLSISQISFDIKKPVDNHMLMCGDTAGMIHPLCGNGMGMAIHSAQIVSKLVLDFINGEIKTRAQLEKAYRKQWNAHFLVRVYTGKCLATLYKMSSLSQMLIGVLKFFPSTLGKIIKQTHGKPLQPEVI